MTTTSSLYFTFLALAAPFSLGKIFVDVSNIPNLQYDFVVVGGGTAGNVVANRLTENPSFRVLVIEDGPSNDGVIDSSVPFFAPHLQQSAYDWNYTTTPQRGLGGRVLTYPRGHILGGSSAINGMVYTRGSSDDFDRFARVTGDNGWSWKNITPYIYKNERWTLPIDRHNTSGQYDPAIHNLHGINAVSLPGFQHTQLNARVAEAMKELPQEFPFNLDMNSGRPLGLGWQQSTIKEGVRSTSATSYLARQYINRSNLDVLLHTRVTRLLPTRGPGLSFKTVEFTQSRNGPRYTLTAKNEIILSAGAIGTPHILLHSGIGDPQDLTSIGIKPLLNLPSVGKNLTDHTSLMISWAVNSTDPLDSMTDGSPLFEQYYREWNETHKGALGVTGITHIAWSRIPDDASIFQKYSDPSSGPNSAHLEMAVFLLGLTLALVMVTPTARGSVELQTNDPFDPPLINPALLDSEFDLYAMRENVKKAKLFASAQAWKGFAIGLKGSIANATTDELLDAYIKENSDTSYHPVSTAAMSAKGAVYGVVDPDLRVKGASGLRIVDASVMPFVICGHTQAPTYAIAERGADLIKEFWK